MVHLACRAGAGDRVTCGYDAARVLRDLRWQRAPEYPP